MKTEAKPAVARLEVDKTAQTVKAFGKAGELIAFFPASVGSDEKPTPSGVLKVTSIDARPNYRYNPDYKFKGVKSRRSFYDQARPQQPCRLSLDRTFSAKDTAFTGPQPVEGQQVRITRLCALTNWDVDRLAKLLKKGAEVAFVEREAANRK